MCREGAGKLLHDDLLLNSCISPEEGTNLGAKVAIDRGRELKRSQRSSQEDGLVFIRAF